MRHVSGAGADAHVGGHGQNVLNREDLGASTIEYALLVGLVALIIFAAVALVGTNATDLFSSVSSGF